MREGCTSCKYIKRVTDEHCYAAFCCGNEDSDNYNVPVYYDDTCDDWEEKE